VDKSVDGGQAQQVNQRKIQVIVNLIKK